VYVGLQAVLSDWLERDAVDINARNGLGETLLSLASRTGNLPLCKQLLQKGAEVNPKPESDSSPLPAAAKYGHREVAQLLIQHKAKINTGGDFDAPLMQGRVLEDVEFVRLLLENGADPNIVRGRQFKLASPLISAVSWRYLDAVRLLLKGKADINLTVDGPFHTALCAATGWDYPMPEPDNAIIEFLMQAGADFDIVGGQFGTALGAAFCGEFHIETRRTDRVELLLSKGAKFRPEDYKGPNIRLSDPIGESCRLYDLSCKVEEYFDYRWIEWDQEYNGEATYLPSS
jgi:ankyrin repeat protein